jgi:hypothetical protein
LSHQQRNGATNMKTYKVVIESNLNKVSLKDYTVKYVDVQAENEILAVANVQEQCGDNFIVSLVSVM